MPEAFEFYGGFAAHSRPCLTANGIDLTQHVLYSKATAKGVWYLMQKIHMRARKNIALIAHDNRKTDLLEWVKFNKELLRKHTLFATGTTGHILSHETGLYVFCFKSGPLGGDQQVGAKIVEGKLDFLVFFWDPLLPHPHDPDVKALLRIAVLWNIPVACNRASADFMISSHLMNETYERLVMDSEAFQPAPHQELPATEDTVSGMLATAA